MIPTDIERIAGALAPVAVGGVGGSGTRVIAQFLRAAGYYIGSDLNESNDNLWSSLLFNRLDAVVEPREVFATWVRMFYWRMSCPRPWHPEDAIFTAVNALAAKPRLQHTPDWLKKRAATFLAAADCEPRPVWGWKMPPIHVHIERLLELDSSLLYIHVVRNGLDMAFSTNRNQLRLWGPIFLGREVSLTPQDALRYWCAAHRRIRTIAARFGDRMLFVSFERFCTEPSAVCREICAFAGREVADDVVEQFAAEIAAPQSLGRFRDKSLADFDPADIAYVEEWGYSLT